jgi:bilin biosynthesis protein
MDKRFFNLFNLTEDQAIALLDTPQDQISEDDSRYIAASHLVNFPTERSINALIRAVQQTDPVLENRIVRRKSVETLGRLQAVQALPIIHDCLDEEDCYLVENAVWAIGEIGTPDPTMLESVAQVLDKPGQTYRVVIHTLAKLNYQPALERIRRFMDHSDLTIASAAITTICRFTQDYAQMGKVVALLQNRNVLARRLSIQDLIDARYYPAIPEIAQCPVSLVFRLRGMRMLGELGIADGKLSFEQIQPHLERSLIDHPSSLNLVHQYSTIPALPDLIQQLYETDFGRCYLAVQTIVEHYAAEAPAVLLTTYQEEARSDYGVHFHVVKLFGWLKQIEAYDCLLEALQNRQPQFQKSRAAAAIAFAEIGDQRSIPELQACLESPIWDLKYAAMLALERFGEAIDYEKMATDDDWLIREKAKTKLTR